VDLALYDSLREAGFKVFLDHFVLPAGGEMERFPLDNSRVGASGVVGPGDAGTSKSLQGELQAMRTLRGERE